MLNDIKSAEEEYSLGKIKSGTVQDLLKDIQIIDNWNILINSLAMDYIQNWNNVYNLIPTG